MIRNLTLGGLVAACLVIGACGSDELELPATSTPTTQPSPTPSPTPEPEYVRFLGVPLHPSLQAARRPESLLDDVCAWDGLMRIADPRQAGWGDLIQNVLNKDVQCFTTAEGAHVIRTFYLDVLEAEGWTVKEVSTLDQGDIAIYAEREQGLEQVGIGSIQEGSVISGYKRHVAIAVIPAPD